MNEVNRYQPIYLQKVRTSCFEEKRVKNFLIFGNDNDMRRSSVSEPTKKTNIERKNVDVLNSEITARILVIVCSRIV